MAPIVGRILVPTPPSSLDPLSLLDAVRTVAEASGDPAPASLSTRRWDASRPLSEKFADAPAARRICEQLGLGWAKVRQLAFLPARAQLSGLGHALNEKQGNWLTPEHCDFVLALVARRLRVETLSPPQFRAERDVMLADRRIAANLRLPTDVQIAAASGTWERALAHAGLRARGRRGVRHSGPVPIVDILDRCYEHHGVEPTFRDLEVFARANSIPMPKAERGRPYSAYVDEWKQRRREQGLPVPDGPPPTSQRPDYTVDVGAARPGERRAKKRQEDPDEVVDWVTRYLSELNPRERASQRGYDQWARGQDGAPWSSAIGRQGGWAATRDAAWERLRQR